MSSKSLQERKTKHFIRTKIKKEIGGTKMKNKSTRIKKKYLNLFLIIQIENCLKIMFNYKF